MSADRAARTAGGPRRQGRSPVRTLGLVFCLVGTLLMLAGRFMAGAPAALIYVGVSVIVFGWGLLGLSVLRVRS